MARITVEDCLTKENNRFALVQLAAKRTKQILRGSSVRIPETENKPVVTALREIAAGEVRFMTPEELEEQRRREEEARAEAELAAARTATESAPASTNEETLAETSRNGEHGGAEESVL